MNAYLHESLLTVISISIGLLYLLGIIAAIDAIFRARSSQSAIAWSLSLFMFPLIALPLYQFFSSRKFTAYLQSRRSGDAEIHQLVEKLGREMTPGVKASLEPASSPGFANSTQATCWLLNPLAPRIT